MGAQRESDTQFRSHSGTIQKRTELHCETIATRQYTNERGLGFSFPFLERTYRNPTALQYSAHWLGTLMRAHPAKSNGASSSAILTKREPSEWRHSEIELSI